MKNATDKLHLNRFRTLCRWYAEPLNRDELLTSATTNVRVGTVRSSGSQNVGNSISYGRPQSVTDWKGVRPRVREYAAALPATRKMFQEYFTDSSMNAAGETACYKTLTAEVLAPINVLLRFDGLTDQQLTGDKICQWQQLAGDTTIDSQGGHSSDSDDDHAAYAAEVSMRRREASSYYCALRRRKGPKTVALYEMKHQKRLADFEEEDLPHIYSGAKTVHNAVAQNLKDAICQVNYYAGLHGCRYAAFGNYTFTWVVQYQKPNHPQIAGPFRSDAPDPTLKQILYNLSRWAIEEGRLDRWQPLDLFAGKSGINKGSKQVSQPVDKRNSADDRSGSQDAGAQQSSKTSASGASRPRQPGAPPRGRPVKRRHAGADSTAAEDPQSRDEAVPGQRNAVDRQFLTAKAAVVDTRYPERIIGYGVGGPVFLHRVDDELAAVKIARKGTPEAAALAHETTVYMVLRPLWGKHVPRLVAAGQDPEDWAVILGTQYLQGRHLDPAVDGNLLPQLEQALEAVHSFGVMHGDLRPQNVVVTEKQGQLHAWLLDFGYSKTRASQQELAKEMASLSELFDAL